ncbi:MAG: hypothetical protein NZT92_15085, partial [Abditibacteriales bacterium]|nr:hypothetical protein [Abditibacteriales bacterium]MDW8367214.1 hypothetical protein [Abditibacteriales bacterium]
MPTHVKLFWLAITVSVLIALDGLIALIVERRRSQRPRERLPLFSFLTAAVGVLLCFIATLPTSPPFSAGQRLGWGMLIGGAFALVAAWMGQTPTRRDAMSACAWATLGVGLTYWLFRGYPDDALSGFALAACLVGFLWEGSGVRVQSSREHDPKTQTPETFTLTPQPLTFNLYLVSTVALVAALLLAQEHFSGRRLRQIAESLWNVFPLALPALGLAAGVLAQAARRVPRQRVGVGATLGVLAVLLVFGGGVWWLTRRTFNAPSLFLPVATGIISAMVLAFLVSGVQGWKREHVLTFEETTGNPSQPLPVKEGSLPSFAAALAVLIVLFTYLNCIRFLSGYGAALGALAMLLLFVAVDTLLETPSERLRHTLPLAAAMVVAALFRIFLESYDAEYHRVSLYTHYVFIGLATGILLPWCLREISNLRLTHDALRTLVGLPLGFACVALPPLVFVFWGFKPLVGLMAGLVLAQWLAALPT